jgi:hypothetical protein
MAPAVKNWLAHRDISMDERKKLAAKGQAKPDKSFPIANAEDLTSAIRLAKSDSDRRHVIKNAKRLGMESKIPDTWNSDGTLKHSDDGPPDYLGSISVDPTDKLDHGIKGMKWGIRRSDSQIAKATSQRKSEGKEVTSTAKSASTSSTSTSPNKTSSTSSTSTHTQESSQARYSRLKAQAKSGKAHEMDDADLKFFNARTEALAKVAKMNEQQPGWLAKTSKEVLQNTAKASMQAIASAAAQKYINERLIDQLNKAGSKST